MRRNLNNNNNFNFIFLNLVCRSLLNQVVFFEAAFSEWKLSGSCKSKRKACRNPGFVVHSVFLIFEKCHRRFLAIAKIVNSSASVDNFQTFDVICDSSDNDVSTQYVGGSLCIENCADKKETRCVSRLLSHKLQFTSCWGIQEKS